MTIYLQTSFTDRFNGELLGPSEVIIKARIIRKYVATQLCEIFVRKNRQAHAPEVSEANHRARRTYLKRLLRHPCSNARIGWSNDKKTFTVAIPKNHRMSD